MSNNNLKIGDVVLINNKYVYEFQGKSGKIISIEGNHFLIEFPIDQHFDMRLHDGNGIGAKNRCWWIKSKYLINTEEGKEKILKPKIDPEEENWWE